MIYSEVSTSGDTAGSTSSAQRYGRWLFRHRSYTLVPLAIVMLAAAWPWDGRVAEFGMRELLLSMAAIGLLLLAEAIRLNVAGRSEHATCGRGKTLYANRLVTAGVYARVRNPLYLANLMLWIGIVLLTFRPVLVLLVIAVLAVQYQMIIRAEERFLLDLFGQQYREYCRRVPRIIPLIIRSGLAGNMGSELSRPFYWKRALLREHDTIFVVLLGAWGFPTLRLGLLAQDAMVGIPAVWYAVPAVATPVWLVTKWIKKSLRRHAKVSDIAAGKQLPWPYERPFRVVIRSRARVTSGQLPGDSV